MRKVIVGILVLLMMFAAAGCSGGDGGKSNEESGNTEFAAADLAGYINDNIEFTDFMDVVENDILFKVYSIDKENVSDACAYFSTGATAEEIAVVTAAGKAEADGIEEAYRKRIESQKEGFENYVPGELVKLESPAVIRTGNSVIMVVCDDSEKAREVVSEYLNK